MALEHALLVSLAERPGSGLELSRRFDRSIGFFWQASHQQIYRTLGRMVGDGWLTVETVEQAGRPARKVYGLTTTGADALADWLAEPQEAESFRSDFTVRLRGASYGDRAAVVEEVRRHRAEHATRLAAYGAMVARDYPDPGSLSGADLDHYLVLRGGVRLEEFWVAWLGEWLEAHDPTHEPDPASPGNTPTEGARCPARSRTSPSRSRWAIPTEAG